VIETEGGFVKIKPANFVIHKPVSFFSIFYKILATRKKVRDECLDGSLKESKIPRENVLKPL
jgi:hypothetical protein